MTDQWTNNGRRMEPNVPLGRDRLSCVRTWSGREEDRWVRNCACYRLSSLDQQHEDRSG